MDVKIFNENIKFKFRVSAIIIYNNRLLVTQYGDSSFCLPGGYVEIGENTKEAVIRELKEEINLDFNVDYCGMIEHFFTNIRKQKTHEIDVYYNAELSHGTYEGLDMNRIEKDKNSLIYHHFNWINIDELENYNLLPNKIKDVIINNDKNFHYIVKD